ncbi:hypothetical protein BG004_003328, partial [Podila humilis]
LSYKRKVRYILDKVSQLLLPSWRLPCFCNLDVVGGGSRQSWCPVGLCLASHLCLSLLWLGSWARSDPCFQHSYRRHWCFHHRI